MVNLGLASPLAGRASSRSSSTPDVAGVGAGGMGRRPRVPAVPPELRRRIPAESSPVRERWMHGGGGDGSRVDEDFFLFVQARSVER
jgi:hypothetical protein